MRQFETYKIKNEEAISLLSKRVSKKTQKEVESVEFEKDNEGVVYVFTLKKNEQESDGFTVQKTLIMDQEEAKEFFTNYVSKKYQTTVNSCEANDEYFLIKTEVHDIEESE